MKLQPITRKLRAVKGALFFLWSITLAVGGVFAAASAAASESGVNLAGEKVRLVAGKDGTVQVFDAQGIPRFAIGRYRLLTPLVIANGGNATLVQAESGRRAIQIDFVSKVDPTGARPSIHIQSQFIPSADGIHIRFDIWGLDARAARGSVWAHPVTPPISQAGFKLGRWTRDINHGVPYEVKDGNAAVYSWIDQKATLRLPSSSNNWTVDDYLPCALVQTGEVGHFVAEADLVFGGVRPKVVAATADGRVVAVDAWTDQTFNLWEKSDRPLLLHTQAVNTSAIVSEITLSWSAHDFNGVVVMKGADEKSLAPGEAWNRDLAFPAPKRGILFVEVVARNGDAEDFVRTNLTVLPPYHFASGDESIFGLAAWFKTPGQEDDLLRLIQRMGVRWFRQAQLTPEKAKSIGIEQDFTSDVVPHDKWSSHPEIKKEWLTEQLNKADNTGAKYLEFGNEWNAPVLQGKDADLYVKDWLVPLSTLRKETGAKVRIMSMGFGGADGVFAKKMADAGGWPLIDALAIHPGRGNFTADYPGREEWNAGQKGNYWNFYGSILEAKSWMAKYGEKDLWITEAYACTKPNDSWYDSYRHAAENVMLSYALAMIEGIKHMDWYQLQDGNWSDVGGINPATDEWYYGLLNRDNTLKPSALAYATVAEALEGAKFIRWISFTDPGTRGLLFETPKGPMAILWYRAEGYILTKRIKNYASPEPWVDGWTIKKQIEIPVRSNAIRVQDSIGQETTVAAKDKKARLILDGAPRIVWGIDENVGIIK